MRRPASAASTSCAGAVVLRDDRWQCDLLRLSAEIERPRYVLEPPPRVSAAERCRATAIVGVGQARDHYRPASCRRILAEQHPPVAAALRPDEMLQDTRLYPNDPLSENQY